VRKVVNHVLTYALSPLGTALNTVGLIVALILFGADPGRPLFWLIVAIFLGSSAMLDFRTYRARRRLGLSAYEATEALTNHVWGPPEERK
jgi:cytochrome c biogenesis factor